MSNCTVEVYGTEEARAEIATMIATGHAETCQLTYARWQAVVEMVAAFAYFQRARMRQFYRIVGAHWDRAGEISVRFDARGMDMRDDVSERRFQWGAIDAVQKTKGATVLRSGMSMIAIPDTAIPEGLTAKEFGARLNDWRSA